MMRDVIARVDDEHALGKRYFRRLTDAELLNWRPRSPRGVFGWHETVDLANVGAANREMRRRAKVAGFSSPYEWIEANKAMIEASQESE